jgi:hypothetical protein
MTELTPQEKLLKLQAMGKMPTDDLLAQKLANAQKEIEKKQRMIDSLKKMVEVQSQIKREAVEVAVNLEAKIEAANKIVKDIKLDAVLASMLAIYEGSSEWNKGYKAGAADMIINIQKEMGPLLEIPSSKDQEPTK